MAKVVSWTRNGDKTIEYTNDAARIEELENAPFDDASNIESTHVED